MLLVLFAQDLHMAHSLDFLNFLLKCLLGVAFPGHSILNSDSSSPYQHAQCPFQTSISPQPLSDAVYVLIIGLRFLFSNLKGSSMTTEIFLFVCLVLCHIPSTWYIVNAQ